MAAVVGISVSQVTHAWEIFRRYHPHALRLRLTGRIANTVNNVNAGGTSRYLLTPFALSSTIALCFLFLSL